MHKSYILTTASLCKADEAWLVSRAAKVKRGEVPVIPQLENQKDLMKMVAILLSTGINRNDDVFLPREVLPVRNTGAHKPVNLEHDPKKIIGHMVRTYASEKSGKRVPDGKKPKGKQFDIIAESVIYQYLFPELAIDIKERAQAGELFVSVEVWFTAYDYLVGSKIVKRTSETASLLESTLRINGGEGIFEGQRTARVLRNMIIGGIGVVKDPANPESIIKSVSNSQIEVVQDIEDKTIAENVLGDLSQNLKLEEEAIELTEQEVSMALNSEVIKEMAALAAAIKAKAEEHETADIELDEESRENPILQKVLARLETLEQESRDAKTQLEKAEARAEIERRVKALTDLGLTDDIIEQHVTARFNMSENEFDEYLVLLKATLDTIVMGQQATASADATEATESTEGGDSATEEAEEASEEATETEEATEEPAAEESAEEPKAEEPKEEAPAPEEPKAEEPEATSTDEAAEETEEESEEDSEEADAEETVEPEASDDSDDDEEEEIEVDIEAVDPNLNVQTGGDKETSLADEMADVVQQFLTRHDPNSKWKKLAIQK